MFQSTRPHGARPSRSTRRRKRSRFNPRARTGRDAASATHSPGPKGFNPRARTGRDLQRGERYYPTQVSIHAPARGATSCSRISVTRSSSFNPRARTGRDRRYRRLDHAHLRFNPRARTGRDHPCRPQPYDATARFNPRARTGRDLPWRSACRLRMPFQSTRPHGARRGREILAAAGVGVSIHAPARGATTSRSYFRSTISSFNPRARTGRDMPHATAMRSSQRFNPRARTGRDANANANASARACFNPRARTGRDGRVQCSVRPVRVSIHAPARGATVQGVTRTGARCCFNPRARTGRDGQPWREVLVLQWFQSTRPHGARLALALSLALGRVFQSTRPHGARRAGTCSN